MKDLDCVCKICDRFIEEGDKCIDCENAEKRLDNKIHIDLDEICDFQFDKCDICGLETNELVDYPGYILCHKCKLKYPFIKKEAIK